MTESEVNGKHDQIRNEARKRIFFMYPIFASILYKTRWELDYHAPEGAGAYVQFADMKSDKLCGNAIKINSKELENPRFNSGNYIFILLHEIMHVISGHNCRCNDRNSFLWNLATDHTINTFIKRMANENKNSESIKPADRDDIDENNQKIVMKGWDTCFIDKDLDEKHANLTAEEVYDYLVNENAKRFSFKEINGESGDGEGNGDENSSNNQSSNKNKKQKSKNESEESKKSKSDSTNNKDKSSNKGNQSQNQNGKPNKNGNTKWVEVTDNKTGKKYIINAQPVDSNMKTGEKDVQSEAREHIRQQQAGSMPGFMKEYLDKILMVKLPWQEILKNAIKQNSVFLPAGRGWKQLNKNYLCHNLTLPGLNYEEVNSAVGSLIITVDTSGSIASEDLKKFAGIINNSFQYFKEIILLTHDVEVHQREKFTADNSDKFLSFVENIGFEGRGGTSHKPVFDEIQKIYKESDDPISMVMSLTDGYSDIETSWNDNEWSKNNKIPTYIIITEDGTLINGIDETLTSVNQKNPRQIKISK